MVLAHVGQGFGVDDVIPIAGAQQLEKIGPTFGERGREKGEASIADLGGDAVLALMPSTGVIDRDPRSARQTGT